MYIAARYLCRTQSIVSRCFVPLSLRILTAQCLRRKSHSAIQGGYINNRAHNAVHLSMPLFFFFASLSLSSAPTVTSQPAKTANQPINPLIVPPVYPCSFEQTRVATMSFTSGGCRPARS